MNTHRRGGRPRTRLGLGLTTIAAALAASALALPALAQQEKEAQEEKEPVLVKMTTSMGDITIELNPEKAPISVANFLKYVDEGFYNGTIFHRVIDNFMIQGGGYDENLGPKRPTHPPIQNEWRNGLKNVRGSIAMARTQIADSATSQFYINVVDNPFLDEPRDGAAYAVFGKVVEGMDVVDKIRTVSTAASKGMQNVPVSPVVIQSVKRVEESEHGEGHDGDG